MGWYRRGASDQLGMPELHDVLRESEQARQLAFTPAQVASPLACQPYDLRHAALSTCICRADCFDAPPRWQWLLES